MDSAQVSAALKNSTSRPRFGHETVYWAGNFIGINPSALPLRPRTERLQNLPAFASPPFVRRWRFKMSLGAGKPIRPLSDSRTSPASSREIVAGQRPGAGAAEYSVTIEIAVADQRVVWRSFHCRPLRVQPDARAGDKIWQILASSGISSFSVRLTWWTAALIIPEPIYLSEPTGANTAAASIDPAPASKSTVASADCPAAGHGFLFCQGTLAKEKILAQSTKVPQHRRSRRQEFPIASADK